MSTTHRELHEIPNPQVLDSAKQFLNGYRLLMEHSPAGVLLPALHCASIALELYLKSLSAKEIEQPSDLGSFIYAKSPRSHKLEDLFDQAPPDIQELIDDAAMERERLHRFKSARKVLEAHNPMFMASRYSFESSSELSEFVIEELDQLLETLNDVICSIPQRWLPE